MTKIDYNQWFLRTDPIRFARASEIIEEIYRARDLDPPYVFYCRSPFEAIFRAAQIVQHVDTFGKASMRVACSIQDVEGNNNIVDQQVIFGANPRGYESGLGKFVLQREYRLNGTPTSRLRTPVGIGWNINMLITRWTMNTTRWSKAYPQMYQTLKKEQKQKRIDVTMARDALFDWSMFFRFPNIFYLVALQDHNAEEDETDRLAIELLDHAFLTILTTGFAFVIDRPEEFHISPKTGKLTAVGRPAIRFRDGAGPYSVGSLYLEEPIRSFNSYSPYAESLSARHIDIEPNVEIRTAMLEEYGTGRWLKETGARLVHKDEYGELYRREEPFAGEREPVVMVKVVNATPEPDGSYREFFLRVPPVITTARGGVAWSFEMSTSEYAPIAQS